MTLQLLGCAGCGRRRAQYKHGSQAIGYCRQCRFPRCGTCDPRWRGCPSCQGRKMRVIPVYGRKA